jgi:hypothetical protein
MLTIPGLVPGRKEKKIYAILFKITTLQHCGTLSKKSVGCLPAFPAAGDKTSQYFAGHRFFKKICFSNNVYIPETCRPARIIT